MIGDFRRGKEIGKGSFATVFLAQHRVRTLLTIPEMLPRQRLECKTWLTNCVDEEIIRCCQGRADG